VPGGGYDFIKSAFDSQGIYAVISIQIKRRNPSTNDYDAYYPGILDLKPKQFVIENNYIEAPILDNSKLVKFKDRDENELDFFAEKSIDDVALTPFSKEFSVNLQPVDVVLLAEYENERFAPAFTGTDNFEIIRWATIIDQLINEIGDDLVVGTDEKVYTNNSGATVVIDVNMAGTLAGNGSYENYKIFTFTLHHDLYIETYTSADVVIDSDLIESNTASLWAYTNGDYSFSKAVSTSKSYSIPDGGYLVIYTKWKLSSTAGLNLNVSCNDISQFNTNLGIDITGYEETPTQCLFPFELLTRGLQIITSETDTSKLLDAPVFGRTDSEFTTYASNGAYCYDAVFSGRMVRQYEGATITAKFKDLFNSFRAMYGIGLGFDNVNNRFYIKAAADFFDASDEMFDLGQVKDLKISPMSEAYFNKIVAGFDNEGDYESAQGAFEFAVKREYSTSTPVKEEFSNQSKLRADSVGIEYARKKQYSIKASEDYRDDNALFVVKSDGTDAIQGGADSGFLGVEKYYNLDKTPRQNLVRNGGLIASTLHGTTDGVKAQSVSKTFDLTVDGKDENSDITKTELGAALFLPLIYELESKIADDMVNILLENPHGYVKFSNFGTEYHGFIYKVEMGQSKAPSHNDKAIFTLIAKEVS
jgi:hypothetical protein